MTETTMFKIIPVIQAKFNIIRIDAIKMIQQFDEATLNAYKIEAGI
jgi:hypothetical protein